jgi:hypothetical protein
VVGSAAIPGVTDVTYVLQTAPAKGSVVVAPNGSFTYTATKNKELTDSFTVLATDGNGDTAIVTVTVVLDKVGGNVKPGGTGNGGGGNPNDARSPNDPAPTAVPDDEDDEPVEAR